MSILSVGVYDIIEGGREWRGEVAKKVEKTLDDDVI